MTDREVKVTTVIACLLWAAGTVVVAVGVFAKVYGIPAVGLMLAMGAGVLHIRSYVVMCETRLKDSFEAGRDYQRVHGSDASVHPVR